MSCYPPIPPDPPAGSHMHYVRRYRQFHPPEADRIAGVFELASQDLAMQFRDYTMIRENLSDHWSGMAYTAYMDLFRDIPGKIMDLSTLLGQRAGALRRLTVTEYTWEKVYEPEMDVPA